METKEIKKLIEVLENCISIYKTEKIEFVNKQTNLEEITNKLNKEVTIMKEDISLLQRTLYGEDKTGFKGVVQTTKELNNSILSLSDSFNEKIGDLSISLTSFMNEFKEKEIQKNTTIKNINIIYTLLSSTGFVAFCGFVYKLLIK